jgi:PAS domain S-box-containing protein
MESAARRDTPPHAAERGPADASHGAGRYITAPEATGELHSAMLDALDVHVALLDESGIVLAVNRAWELAAPSLYGRPVGVGVSYLAACDEAPDPGGTTQHIAGLLRELIAGGGEDGFVADHAVGIAGEEHWYEVRARRLESGRRPRIILSEREATARVAAERAARRRANILDQAGAAIIAGDLHGTIELWNEGAEALYGWNAAEVVGRNGIDVIVPPADRDEAWVGLKALRDVGRRVGERALVRKDGTPFYAQVNSVACRDAAGEQTGTVSVAVDITERVQAERELRGARDYLRAVTDSMGEALCTLDTDGRVRYMNAAAERVLGWKLAELRGRRLHDSVHFRRPDGEPSPIEESQMLAAASSGSTARVEEDEFVRRDGSALPVAYTSAPFQAENGTGGLVVVFSDITERKAQQDRMRREIALLSQLGDLRDALDEDRFVLYAQPIIVVATGALFSHELLIRMVERDGALRAPAVFLPAAEECGLIRDIDRWVIRQATELAGRGHRIELNLSATSLGDPDLFAVFQDAMEHSGAAPGDIVVELTETALMRDEAIAAAFIQRIGMLGCAFALDDFGMGFGGFGYLKRLPVDYLKIDVEFVRDLRTNVASRHVVEAVVSLAEAFGQRTVAEGVEDEETLALIGAMGVDLAQGFAIGRPVPLHLSLLA